jgi:hypothetical protein
MRFEVKLDFEYFYDNEDVWGTALSLPNGVVISFWDCKMKYVHNSEEHYILFNSVQKQNIEEAILLLSFFTTVPLIAIDKTFVRTDIDYYETQKQNGATKNWCEKLELISRKLKTRSNRKRRVEILSLMRICTLGSLHEYREHKEEQFFMYFKTVEKIAKLQIDKKRVLCDSEGNRKKSFKSFVSELLIDEFSNTIFDDDTLDEIVESLIGSLERYLGSKNHRRIVIALSSLVNDLADGETSNKLRDIDSSRIKRLVRIRNDIAHGNSLTITFDDLADIEYLSRQMISIFYFGFRFEKYYLKSAKFGKNQW